MTTELTLDTAPDTRGRTTLAATGEIDQTNVDEFCAALADATAAVVGTGEKLNVDLTGVTYLDSAAISVLYTHVDGITLTITSRLVRIVSVSGLSELVGVEVSPA